MAGLTNTIPMLFRAASPTRAKGVLYSGVLLGALMFFNAVPSIAAPGPVKGSIQGVSLVGFNVRIVGWACQDGVSDPIAVHVYVNGAAGAGGTLLSSGVANFALPLAPSAAASCRTQTGAHGFQIDIPNRYVQPYLGKSIYVYGIHKTGAFPNPALEYSGAFKIPIEVARIAPSGLDLTGSSDNSNAIQKAADELAALGGGTLAIPAGTLRTDRMVSLGSYTRLVCAPAEGSVFRPVYSFTVFANTRYKTIDPLNDMTPPIDANQADRNISIEGCVFDFRSLGSSLSPSPVNAHDRANAGRFWLARNTSFKGNRVIGNIQPARSGSTYYGIASGASCIGVNGCEIKGNRFSGVSMAADVWKGSRNVAIQDNEIDLFYNNDALRGNSYCIGVNARGSSPAEHLTSSDILISGNQCLTRGYQAGIQFDTLSSGSVVSRAQVVSNRISALAGTSKNWGIFGRGRVSEVTVSGNDIEGVQLYPLLVTDFFSSGGPWSCTDCLATTAGSTRVEIRLPALTTRDVVVGSRILFSSGTASVGGVSFAGRYLPVVEIVAGQRVVVSAPSAATASAVGGGSVTTNVWWGAPDKIKVTDNRFHGVNTDRAVITLVGTNGLIGDNSATGGSYASFTYTSSLFAGAVWSGAHILWRNSAAPGTGYPGAAGDGVNAYPAASPPVFRSGPP